MAAKELPCLHCGDEIRPRTSEHVLQKGFGTNLTLPDDVCGDCNTRVFSPLDDRLVKFVRINLCWDHPDVRAERTILQEGLGLFLDEPSNTWVSVLIDRKDNLVIPPQVVFPGENRVRFVADGNRNADYKPLLNALREELREPSCLDIKVEIRGDLRPALQPALVRTGRRKFLLRAPSEESARELHAAIDSGQLLTDWQRQGTESGKTLNPEIQLRASWYFGDVARAIAKTAVNFACVALGPIVARDPLFDTVRQFILHSDGSDFARFVIFLFGDTVAGDAVAFPQSLARAGHHTLLFAIDDGVPIVMVVLYQRPFAVIRLSETPHPALFKPATVALGLFDYRSKTHRILKLRDNPSEFAKFIGPSFGWRTDETLLDDA